MVNGLSIIITIVSVLLIVLFLAYIIGIYNALVRVRNNIKKSWSNIDVLLKQRSDELPNLVESVKGYMKHERTTLETITKARSDLLNTQSIAQKAVADNQIHAALKSLFAVAENYPSLKANENFLKLQTRISDIENQIADRREFYNESVTIWNTKIESFPDLFIAKMIRAAQQELFKATDQERLTVVVDTNVK